MDPTGDSGPSDLSSGGAFSAHRDSPTDGFGIKLGNIFEEVENNLPSIDFDISDVSSDEDVAIFQRTIKTPTFDEDKDLDESMTSDSWEEVLRSTNVTNATTPDNDIMARLQHEQHSGGTVESSVTLPVGETLSLTTGFLDINGGVMVPNHRDGDDGDGASTLSLRSIREVEDKVDGSTLSALTTSGPAVPVVTLKTQSIGTNTDTSLCDADIKINTWVCSTSSTSTESDSAQMVPECFQKVSDIPQGGVSHEGDNKLNEKNQNAQETRPRDLVSRYLPTRAPSLTFQDLDNVDLDAALSMEAVGHPTSLPFHHPLCTPTVTSSPRSSPRLASASGCSPATGSSVLQADDDDNVSLIEKLARLSVAQSGTAMRQYDPDTGALTHIDPENRDNSCQPQPSQPGHTSHQPQPPQPGESLRLSPDPGVNTKAMKTAMNKDVEARQKYDLSGVSSELPGPLAFGEAFMTQLTGPPRKPKARKRETVYIDLRNFDVEKHNQQMSFEAVQRILRLPPQSQPEESSEEEDEDPAPSRDLSLWHEQRRKMKEALRAGKSIARLEDYDTEKSTEAAKPSNSSQPSAEDQTRQESTAASPGSKETTVTVKPSATSSTKPAVAEGAVSGYTAKPPILTSQAEKERQKRIDAARHAREARAVEHQSRVRLSEHLEALRPTTTKTERHPAAEATPVVFDLEASYEPALENLPSQIPLERDILLLTVHMACNGEIILHRGTTNRSVDSGDGLSASYTTLVTWILSLVPDDFSPFVSTRLPGFCTTIHTGVPGIPFQVLGMQQMMLDDQMALYIAVCPTVHTAHRDMSPKTKKTKKRDEFSGVLSKFLSTHTLHTVCPWLQDLVSMEVTSPLSDAQQPFVYRPPLPNITTKPLSTFIQINGGMEAVQRVFGLPVGFFWHTVEADDTQADVGNDAGNDHDVQNTMSLVYKRIYRDPHAMLGILNRLLQEGLDLSALRLLYPTTALMSVAAGNLSAATESCPSSQLDLLNKVGPIVSLAIRGMLARTIWLDAVGPVDPILARRTDPNSLCALYGGNLRDECLLFCPRNPERIRTELARWFGGRVPASGVINVGMGHRKRNNSGSKRTKGGKSADAATSEYEAEIPTHNPPAMLTATTHGHILLVISPLLPVRCLGLVLATCQRRGYRLHGIRRQRLAAKRANGLGLTGVQVSAFTRGSCLSQQRDGMPYTDVSIDPAGGDVPSIRIPPSTTLLLNKENAVHGAASLIEAFMVQLCLMDLLGSIQAEVTELLTSSLLFHTLPYSVSAMTILGRDFSKVPEVDRVITPGYIAPKLHTNPEMEQLVVVTLTGHANMNNLGLVLGRLLGVVPLSRSSSGPPFPDSFELLAIKWMPALSMQHAKELTPYEVGDPQWRSSLQKLMSDPAVVILLRGINAFRRLDTILGTSCQPVGPHRAKKPSLECLVSRTPDTTYRQMALFFWEREVYTDPTARKLLAFLPPPRTHRPSQAERPHAGPAQGESSDTCREESLFDTMLSGPRPIVTLLIAKPDVVRRHLGKLLKRVSLDGFALVGARLVLLTPEQADLAIPQEDKQDEVLRDMHRTYLTSAPSMVLALQRENAVWRLQWQLGPIDPTAARKAGQHYWRALFGTDTIVNGLHGSASYAAAVREVSAFFPEGLCCQPNMDLEEDGIPCPAEDSTIDIHPTRKVIKALPAVQTPAEQTSLPFITTRSSGTISASWSLQTSTLTETNCIMLMPALLKQQCHGRKAAYVDIADALFSNGFDVVAARLVWLSEMQAEHYLCLIKAGSFQMVPLLTSGPCLVLALQRDNAVIAFDSLLGTSYVKDSTYSKYGAQIMRPTDTKNAQKHIAFFFNSLSPLAQLSIVPGEEFPMANT